MTWVWILIVIVIAVVVFAAMGARQRRSAALRERFGPEYERTVEATEDRRAAEAELREREKQHALLDLKPLSEDERAGFAREWLNVQEHFVDQPAEAVVAADGLVYRVMDARGYPMMNFDAQAAIVSVDHPDVVENYRIAHAIRERAEEQQASTEDLREALLRYRSLFDELLRAGEDEAGATATREPDDTIDDGSTGPAHAGQASDGQASNDQASAGESTDLAAEVAGSREAR